jgi:outer membrane lipoprotein-sorting protein
MQSYEYILRGLNPDEITFGMAFRVMTLNMRVTINGICILAISFFILTSANKSFAPQQPQDANSTSPPAQIQPEKHLTGDEIMQKVRENEYSESLRSITYQTLVDKNNKAQQRLFVLERKKENVLIRFLEPPDLKNIGYLVIKDQKDPEKDLVYVYFPPPTDDYRQINVDDKNSSESFLGSDFDVTDFQIRDPEETTNTYLRTESISEKEVHVVESIPMDKEYKYGKMIFWVSSLYWLPIRTQFFDHQDNMVKEMKVFKIKTMDERKVASKFQMETLATSHKTIMEVKEVKFDVTFPEDHFSIRILTNP